MLKQLRRRVRKLTALLRLALALPQTSGFRLSAARLPDGGDELRILRAVDRAREYLPLRALLRFLRVSPSRFHPGAAGVARRHTARHIRLVYKVDRLEV